jgi:hypothetical protein
MKKNLSFTALLAGILFLPTMGGLHAQEAFEGSITWSMTIPKTGGEKHLMIINTKGKKFETETDMGASGFFKTFSDGDTKKLYVLNVNKRQGFVMENPGESSNGSMANKASDSVDLKPTGQKATIDGHPAEEYILRSPNSATETSFWVTADFPKEMKDVFYHSLNTNQSPDPNKSRALKIFNERGLVPIRIVVRVGAQVALTMEFVKYEEKHLDAALFIPPTDIQFNPLPQPGGGVMVH